MNVYHITYGPATKTVHLHFWGCNLECRACLLKREIYDCHLTETKERIRQPQSTFNHSPEKFLDLKEVIQLLGKLEVDKVILMGGEAALDSQLPQLTEAFHRVFSSYNVLLSNGFHIPDLSHVDEVVISIKAYTNALHRKYTGASNKKSLENFLSLYQRGIRLRTESIFIPEYIDGPEIERIARFIGGVDKNRPYRIDAYIPTGDNLWRRPAPGEIEHAANLARKYLTNVSYLTGSESLRYEVVRVF
jgi:pyruvate formate lyase activating enzyme